ncbi:hypothetical protein HZS_7563 [Henneguya salminicola]|nr:hypothetical protein HZS_7563 [Henneguya salminicola]
MISASLFIKIKLASPNTNSTISKIDFLNSENFKTRLPTYSKFKLDILNLLSWEKRTPLSTSIRVRIIEAYNRRNSWLKNSRSIRS